MTKIIASISMSLDGFIAGQHISEDMPMGENGDLLHHWMFTDRTDDDKKIIDDLFERSGAVILGSTTYNLGIKTGWNGKSPFKAHAFVLVSNDPVVETPGFTFVREGLQSALAQAKQVAKGKDVWVMGGANVVRQFIYEKMLDELHIHIAPVVLAKGTPLFSASVSKQIDLITTNTITTKKATHLFYTITK